MADDKTKQNHARDSHDDFLAIGGGEKARRAILADADDGCCHKIRYFLPKYWMATEKAAAYFFCGFTQIAQE